MEKIPSKTSKVVIVRDTRNLLLLVLIGLLLSAILIEAIYFLKFSFNIAMPIVIICAVFYLILIILLAPSKKIIRKTRIVKQMPKPQKINEQDIKNAVKEAIEEEKLQEELKEKPKITLHKPKYVASTQGTTYHKVSCRLGRLIKRKYKLTNDSAEFFKRQKYKPCNLCLVETKPAKKKATKKTTKKAKKK